MTREHALTAEELNSFIRTYKSQVVGSATHEGMLYHEIPFAGYEKLSVHRAHSADRVQLVCENLDLRGKNVLDLGCNVGYFCFEFARLGATCWGIDYDKDAIFIARSLKYIHEVENVHFVTREFSSEAISYLLDQAGHFDVILLNSVVHWLLYNHHGSLRRVAALLNRLVSPEKQYIVYEPSSSDSAYYPEELTRAGVERFFRQLGVCSYRRIGTMFAANVDSKREIWLGERDIHAVIRETHDFLAQQPPAVGQKMGQMQVVHAKYDKVCFRYGSLFIKTAVNKNSYHNFLLRNELAGVKKMAGYAEYMPVLIAGTELDGRIYLVYEWIEGRLLANTIVVKRDFVWIARELLHFLQVLEWVGLAHNDLRPHNVFLLPDSNSIVLIDFEHCGPRFNRKNRPEQPDQWLLEYPTSAEEHQVLDEQLLWLGGEWRSPYGPGCYENDRYAVNKMIFQLKNRRRYALLLLIRVRNRLRDWLARTRLGRKLSTHKRKLAEIR